MPVPTGVQTGVRLPTVRVGAFEVVDLHADALVPAIVSGALAERAQQPYIASPCHVGSLNLIGHQRYEKALSATDVVYADGVSVVMLARLAGARRLVRSSTTDIGWRLLDEVARQLGRAPRVAIVGGPGDLGERAASVLSGRLGLHVVYTTHGFHSNWPPVVAELARREPDVLLVGLGQPLENVWCDEYRPLLPPCLVLTCGGWLGFVTGDEKRAPSWMQRRGLEWAFRLWKAPSRFIGRYAHGVGRTLALVPRTLRDRHNLRSG